MKHLNNLCKAMIGICLCIPLIANATDPAPVSVTKDDLSTQKELLQMQIDSKKELLQKDIEAQTKQIEAFDKRVDDQTNRISDVGFAVDRLGIIAGVLGTLITVLLVGFGFVGYRAARSDAKETAKEESNKWFEQNKQLFSTQIQDIEKKLQQAIDQIDFHVKAVKDRSDAAGVAIESAVIDMQTMQQQMNQINSDLKTPDLRKAGSSAVEQLAEELKQRPESSYSFADWNARAFAAYKEGKLEDAAFYWGKAADVPASGAINSAQALFNKGLALGQFNRGEEEITAYDALIQKYSNDPQVGLREQVANAMFNKGFRLGQLDRIEEEIITYDVLIQRYSEDTQTELRGQVVKAMFNKGFRLGQLGRGEEEIAIYDVLIHRYSEDSNVALRRQVAMAIVNKGFRLSRLSRDEEAIATYDSLIQKYREIPEVELREQVAKAMLNKGITLGKLNRDEEAIFTFSALIQQYSEDSQTELREQVAMAMLKKGDALNQLNLNEEAVVVYDGLIQKFGEFPEVELRKVVVQAMFNKGTRLGQLNRYQEMIVVFDSLIQKLGKSSEVELHERVADAENGKGFYLLCYAKSIWEQPEKAQKLLDQAKELFKQAVDKMPNNGVIYGNLAYTAWLQGEQGKAEQHFQEGLSAQNIGGESLYLATLDDFKVHPIEPDKGYRELVEKLWAEFQQNQMS